MLSEACFQEGCGLTWEQSEAEQAFAEPTVCTGSAHSRGVEGKCTVLGVRAHSLAGKLKQHSASSVM